MFFIIIPYSSTFFNSSPPPIPMFYMFEVQIPVDAYPVFGLKRRSFCSRRFIVTISGMRNNVALRFTTLTAEGHGRTNPLISTTFRTWRMCQVFFCIAHASLRSTTNNRRTNSFEPFAQPTVAKIATQRWLQCTTFCFIII